jgi:alkylation response protein AidB-like acyl-CoA dehydrogenase
MDFELSEEMRVFRRQVRKWVDKETPKDYARELERHEHDYPFDLWDKFTKAGYHGLSVPEEYGGEGGDIITQMVLARELCRSLGGLSWVWGLTSFAGSKSIGIYGSDEQKERFLPAIARGELRFSIGFTEPGGGTDVLGAMKTKATKVDGGWSISGTKIWCSSAHVADYILLLARTDENVAKRHQGVTLFLLPAKTTEGVQITELPKLGMRAIGSCQVNLNNAFVPDDLVLGEPGKAWYMLLPTLNNERVMVGSFCVGILDAVLEDALDYVKQREAFGRTIGEFQILQHYIADIAMMQRQAELMVYQAATLLNEGKPCHLEASMAKVVASDYAVKAADLGIQILGGMGYSAETDMQRYWRDARLWRIGPITNEMARNAIAENLGLPRSF